MKIDCISDIHALFNLTGLEFSDAEMLIVAGDIGNQSSRREVEEQFSQLDECPHEHIIFVPGNHDTFFEDSLNIIPKTRAHILIDDVVEIEGLRIAGSPYTPMFCNWAFMKEDEELAEHWERVVLPDIDVLVTHGPPYSICDMTLEERFAGSKSLLRAVLKNKPKVHVFGHIHEAHGQNEVDGIRFYNVSLVNRMYVHVNPVTTIEL